MSKTSMWIGLLIVVVLGAILTVAVSRVPGRGAAAYLAVGLPVLGLVVAIAVGFRYFSRGQRD